MARIAALGPVVINPTSGHDTTRLATTTNRRERSDARVVATGAQVGQRRLDLREVRRQLVDDQRQEAQRR